MKYGYVENGCLTAKEIEPVEEKYRDGNGEIQVRTITVADQLELLGDKWKPVDVLDEELVDSADEGHFIKIVPYDDGDHIAFDYVDIEDRQYWKRKLEQAEKALEDEDYKIIKCYEYFLVGKELPYDIVTLNLQRDLIRDQVNEYREKVNSI